MKRIALAGLVVAGAALAAVPEANAEKIPVQTAVQRSTDGESTAKITPVRRRYYGGYYRAPARYYYRPYGYGGYYRPYGSYYGGYYRPYYSGYRYGYGAPFYYGGYGPRFSFGIW